MAKAFTLSIKDKSKVLNNIVLRNKKFLKQVRINFVIGGDEFIQLIRSRWYSGRRGDDTGLNRDTNLLYNTWLATIKPDSTLDIVLNIANGALYAKVHQLGSKDGTIPKRSFVIEDMKGNIGKKIFTDKIRQALKQNF